ncbi:MAG: flagellar protein FlgN [Bdellovibrionales bacterium]|nr:flagellar protein FlgN [Bdellovibrionales bacterium]
MNTERTMGRESEEFQKNFTELDKVLQHEIKIYRNLLDIVRKEKELLVASRLDDLSENNRSKEAQLIKLRSLEQQRVKLATELCQALSLPADEPRLLDISNELGGELGDRLRNLHSVLSLLLKRVHELNQSNERLVNSALNSITGALKSLKSALDENPTYKRQGSEVKGSSQSGQLVSREA